MQTILVHALTQAAGALPLPPGGALRLAPVLPAEPGDLPAAIRSCAQRRRNGFAAGRRAARDALQAAGFRGGAPLGIGADGLPDWPPGWMGSIAHTDDAAAALVAPAGGAAAVLGLDLERIVPGEVAAEICGEIMPETPPGLSGMPPGLEVTRAFSAKEALYKALFPRTRQFRAFSAARLHWHPAGDPARVTLTLTEDWGADWPAGTALEAWQAIAANHVLTIVWR